MHYNVGCYAFAGLTISQGRSNCNSSLPDNFRRWLNLEKGVDYSSIIQEQLVAAVLQLVLLFKTSLQSENVGYENVTVPNNHQTFLYSHFHEKVTAPFRRDFGKEMERVVSGSERILS